EAGPERLPGRTFRQAGPEVVNEPGPSSLVGVTGARGPLCTTIAAPISPATAARASKTMTPISTGVKADSWTTWFRVTWTTRVGATPSPSVVTVYRPRGSAVSVTRPLSSGCRVCRKPPGDV